VPDALGANKTGLVFAGHQFANGYGILGEAFSMDGLIPEKFAGARLNMLVCHDAGLPGSVGGVESHKLGENTTRENLLGRFFKGIQETVVELCPCDDK
jgi:hypothetical protein